MFDRDSMSARIVVAWLGMLLAFCSGSLAAQAPVDSDLADQKANAEKFYQLFLNRPQPGTALDKTVEYYHSIGELDALIQRIKSQAQDAQGDQADVAARRWLAAALIVQSQSRWLESIELLKQAPDVPELRWELGKAQSVAFEQLQRWTSIIDVLQPLIEPALEEPTQSNSTVVIEVAQRLAKAQSRTGQTAGAVKTWQAIEKRFGSDEQIAMRLASLAASEGELEFAIEVLDRVLARKLNPSKRIEVAIQRTSLLARKGDESGAISNYQELLVGLDVESWLATDITHRIEELIIAKDGVDALLDHYRMRLTQHPDDMHVMLRLATLLNSEKRWDESNVLFKQLIERTTTSIEPRRAYAQSLIHQELWHEAVLELEKLSAMAPRDDDVIMQWCEAILADTTMEASARDAQVQKILERSLENVKASVANYQQLAARLQRFGQALRAVHWLSQAHALKPNDMSVLSDYARALVELGQEKLALEILGEFEQDHRQQRAELTQLADLYTDLDQHELAIACLTRACQLGATSAMRFRLADWLHNAGRANDAMVQLELAWAELPLQTRVVSEQESLCEEITRRQLKLATQLGDLPRATARLRTALSPGVAQTELAGMPSKLTARWRLAKFLAAGNEWKQASEQLAEAIMQSPTSPMLWRLRAEIDEHDNRLLEATAALRKLAELDVRRRSEYLLQAAKDLARMGNLDAALRLTESITTETASSQNTIAVFDLANEYGATRFGMELLEKRLQSRPGDLDVLARVIKFHLDSGNLALAADYQWKNLELTRTAEQRELAVQSLIETHYQLSSLDELEAKLDKFWRQRDLWREFGVWQVLISLQNNNRLRAETLLERLAQSQTTRRFAIGHLLKLAKLQNQSAKQFQLMKQLATIDPQSVTTDELARVLREIPLDNRSRAMAEDALGMLRGPSNRLSLIHDLLLAAEVDLALRLIEVLPEQEQQSWPIIFRTALAVAAYPKMNEPPPSHLSHAQTLLDTFVDQSLELPETQVGQPLLEELFGSQKYIVEFLATSTINRDYAPDVRKFNNESLNCTSKLQAYESVIAAQLQTAATPEQRRGVVDSHRQAAMKQPDIRERSARLASLAVIFHWHSKAATVKDAASTARKTIGRLDVRDTEYTAQLRMQLSKSTQSKLAPPDSSLSAQLAHCSMAFSHVIVQLNELADQGDHLASLLCLWELSLRQQDLLKANQEGVFRRAAKHYSNLALYEPFAPSQLVTLVAFARLNDHPEASDDYRQTLSRLSLGRQELQQLLEMVLDQHETTLIEALVTSQLTRMPVADLLGELICRRTSEQAVDALAVLRALDLVWKSEVEHGQRNLATLELPISNSNSRWIHTLPLCSLPMHESSLFKQVDFALLRAVLTQSSSNASRQELLNFLKQLAAEPANDDLRLVRQLSRIFVYELLEQDTQSAKLLDEVLPASSAVSKANKANNANNARLAILRCQWLDLTGRRDAAIAEWLKLEQWPEEIRERSAATLLRLGLDRHDDSAIILAVEQLRAATSNLTAYRDLVAELIRRDKLAQAEALLGDFKVLLTPTDQPLVLVSPNPRVVIQPPSLDQSVISRWQQTDHLFALLRNYSKLDDEEAACRIARRLLDGVNHASDEELRVHLPILVKRLEFSFDKQLHVRKFLEIESQRLEQQDAPREALCILRMTAQANLPKLAEPIVQRLAATQMSALQYLEVAQCEMRLGELERAATFFARAFELQPDWLETSIKDISTSPKAVRLLAKELNDLSNGGSGIGVASMDALLGAIPPGQLRDHANLLIGWASNIQPKSQAHLRFVLTRALKEDFDLWVKIVEQLLLADELQPMVLAYEHGNLWTHPFHQPGVIQLHLLESKFSADKEAMFQAMLRRVLASSRDHFVARVLLFRSFVTSEQLDRLTEQLPLLLQIAKVQTPAKTWVITEWENELINSRTNINPALAAAFQRQTTGAMAPSEIDKAAKAKLLLHLVGSLKNVVNQHEMRVRLLERIADLGCMNILDPFQQSQLLKFYAEKRDEAKILTLFESHLLKLTSPVRGQIPASYDFPISMWKNLASEGMDWVRHMVLVRAAQIEQLPLDKSGFYLAQADSDSNVSYPLSEPAAELLKQYVAKTRQQLSMSKMGAGNSNLWLEAFGPRVVLAPRSQTIQVVSMLDALWPMGQQIIDKDVRSRLSEEVNNWSKDLETSGPWQALAVHNLAARLGDAAIVAQAQDRLLELAASSIHKVDQEWQVACWSAVLSSASIPEVDPLRFRLGEFARTAVLKSQRQQNGLYLLMTMEQLERSSSGRAITAEEKKLVEMMATNAVELGTQGALARVPTTSGENSARTEINFLMFEKLMARGDFDLAIELLQTMQSSRQIYGTARGIAREGDSAQRTLDEERLAKTLALLQHLIDTKTQPEKLLRLVQGLLLEPLNHNWNAGDILTQDGDSFAQDFVDFARVSTVKTEDGSVLWNEAFKATEQLGEQSIPSNMFSQLVKLSQIDGSEAQLQTALAREPKTRAAQFVSGAMLALEMRDLQGAVAIYRKATMAKGIVSNAELTLIRDSIFNVIRLNPLSDTAIEFSVIALERPLNGPTIELMRQQFSFAAQQKNVKVVQKIVASLGTAEKVPLAIRARLRSEYALALLDAQLIKSSIDVYVKAQLKTDVRSREPDRYVLELMNRLPTLDAKDQSELFDCFVSRNYRRFPWLDCYTIPVKQPLPMRFRRPDSTNGLVFQSLDGRRSWGSFLVWIADYAERTGKSAEAIEAATTIGVDDIEVGWGAAALTVRLNPKLTPGALKNRLELARDKATPEAMRALLDCCQHNEQLRTAAVEFILNLGYPEIALAPSSNTPVVASSWKHWLTVRETTLSLVDSERPKWALSKSGQWTAQAATDTWYLMLRYPIEGDFALSLTAQQVSGTKFGIGYGGMGAAQHESNRAVRCLGVAGRRAADLVSSPLLDEADVPLKIERHGDTWALQAASARIEEVAHDAVPLVYLLNQGKGVARIEDWTISSELSIAKQMNLVDAQLRLWRTTQGSWKLPNLRVQVAGGDPQKPKDVSVREGVLHLPASKQAEDHRAEFNAIHCLRPLQAEETVSYEFYHAADSAPVHPALGRIVFLLDDEQLKLQWLCHREETDWLGISNVSRFPIDASERIGGLHLKPDAWNKVQLTLTAENQVAIALNGEQVARVAMPADVIPEFGLTVTQSLPAQVRAVQLTGDWPQSLNLQELTQQ